MGGPPRIAASFYSAKLCTSETFCKIFSHLVFSYSVIIYSISAVSRHNRQSSYHFLCTMSASVASVPAVIEIQSTPLYDYDQQLTLYGLKL